ncbi:MAG: hypothetical protein ACR2O8_13960 [Rhizobiaceae bacterium]
MSRALNKLTARQIDLFHKSPLPDGKSKGRISDGGNLYLVKRDSSSSWYFYFNHQGRRREYRLGALSSLNIAGKEEDQESETNAYRIASRGE